MPPDPPRGSGLWPSVLQSTCLLTSQCPSTSKVNENPATVVTRFHELRTTRHVLESLAPHLKGSEVLQRTDNKNTEIILSIGSRKADLHDEAVSIYKLCRAFDIRLTVEWVSCDYNVVADELSQIEDANDYMLDSSCFMSLDRLWGPHLVARFASEKTK